MPFGLKSAPLIFHQNHLPALNKIKASGIRTMVYIDDILLLDLKLYVAGSNSIKGNFISRRSWLAHQQQISSDFFNTSQISRLGFELQLMKYANPRTHSKKVNLQDSKIQNQIKKKKTSLHLKLLYNALQRVLHQQGWKGLQILQQKLQRDWNWLITSLKQNNPRSFRITASQATLFTDTRRWTKKWRLRTNNQRELAAVLCELTRFSDNLRNEKIYCIYIQTDNTTTSYNFNRQNSSISLSHLFESTVVIAENQGIKIKSTYLSGKYNMEADALSRLNRAGRTALTRRYCTIRIELNAIARDTFTIPWKGETPIIHPPIPLIGRCLQRIKTDIDLWSQCKEERMAVTAGKLVAVWINQNSMDRKASNSSEKQLNPVKQQMKLLKTPSLSSKQTVEDTVKRQVSFLHSWKSSHATLLRCNRVLSILLIANGHSENKRCNRIITKAVKIESRKAAK
ncbi:MAG: hypothetical protein EZS28_016747 [Streblomastix strix]|uniref:Reverse transcriptase domain-containing protein n=1 Tax=Streblomastix strix TaxID=222440 RepID=A0A5J4VZB5_9EUKA|nr:MAG: hypothetical protein EZS28_016747 [Streblomastix strix]